MHKRHVQHICIWITLPCRKRREALESCWLSARKREIWFCTIVVSHELIDLIFGNFSFCSIKDIFSLKNSNCNCSSLPQCVVENSSHLNHLRVKQNDFNKAMGLGENDILFYPKIHAIKTLNHPCNLRMSTNIQTENKHLQTSKCWLSREHLP